jgi:hypothetical protein
MFLYDMLSILTRICHERCTPKEEAAIARLRLALIKLGCIPIIHELEKPK